LIRVKIYEEDNMWVMATEELGVYGVGKNPDDALKDWWNSLIASYQSFVGCPEEQLAPSAVMLRRKLIAEAVDGHLRIDIDCGRYLKDFIEGAF